MSAKSVEDRFHVLCARAGSFTRPFQGVPGVVVLMCLVSVLGVLMLRQEAHLWPFDLQPAQQVANDNLQTEPDDAPSVTSAIIHPENTQYRALAEFLARKYKVSERITLKLVGLAHAAGHQVGLDPLLIISVMAVESGFNPIAESLAGAKGLMQVIPKYHADKLRGYGGEESVFDPRTNILVGSQILKEYLTRTGSLNAALQMYAGASDDQNDAYTAKVMSEKQRLQRIVARSGLRQTTLPRRQAKGSGSSATST